MLLGGSMCCWREAGDAGGKQVLREADVAGGKQVMLWGSG